MKLFSAQEIKDSRQQQTDKEIARGIKVAQLVDDEQKKLAEIQERYETEGKKAREEFSELFETLNQKRSHLESEVGTLEERKHEALKPIEDLKKVLQLKETEFKSLQVTFESQEQDLLAKEIKLAKEQTELQAIRNQMEEERSKADLKLLNIKAQENAVKEGYEKLQEQWGEFTATTEQSAHLINGWETQLGQKEKAFQILQGEIQTQKLDIDLNRTRLLDLQETIRAAFAEARSKNLL